ncbi:tumor necrosis factor receptor superfamily member 5 isoform X1 [Scleropages formosus]|uniref:tumor necrosis factor receptor superfamily member 5 isoform X1 n=1 Tax=Scleropages formosus TaxID=113540 RepID=UPI0010FA8419|nr:tumor necrosis factor receptor superfamily member 5-like isoform X1 [Scleropages formosus]XP_018593344.2 tumor necrosis factor receptor superfamily member 5-like isoform X1 [Scleropages formosus]XP_018593353.2 tumor necrosis factor receptor superfamily member 5-like isoform X1 [Scleropages formosus]
MAAMFPCVAALAVLGYAITALPTQQDSRNSHQGRWRRADLLCPPGEYVTQDRRCVPCPLGYFSAHHSKERSCRRCSQDCREVMHLEAYRSCNATSNTRCKCKEGFECSDYDYETQSCNLCKPVVRAVTEVPCKAGTFFSASSGGCKQHTNCTSLGLTVLTAGNSTHNTICVQRSRTEARVEWWYIFVAVLPFVIVTAVLLIWRLEHKACLKKIIKFGAAEGHKKENLCPPRSPTSVSDLLFGTTSNCSPEPSFGTEPAAPQATGSLGPFHIYSAGTVFVSLLNQVTGVGKDADKERRARREDGDGLGPVEPPSSPPVHLSEEERDEQKDCIFFPSQEQGKEIHLSKEERM